MAVDVREAAVAGSAPSLGAVHVIVTSKHVPWTEVAENRGAHLWSSAVALLGGMQHAVNIAGAGGGPTRWWIRSFPVPAGTKV